MISPGRVLDVVFPVRDLFIYENGDGTTTILMILRRVVRNRNSFGMDFWYTGYYLTGKLQIPDFFKVVVSLSFVVFLY